MDQQYSVVCDEQLAAEIDALAREYGLSHEEVIHQLLTVGLDQLRR